MAKTRTEISTPAKPDSAPLVPVFRIAGADYKVGDSLDFDGDDVTVEGKKLLNASANSGLSSGTYAVVWTMVGPRKAFRAVVDGKLYPIRNYGKEDETIAKIRGPRRREGTEARASSGGRKQESLSSGAEKLLGRYLALKPDTDGGAVLSELVVTHLPSAVEKLEGLQVAIKQLPRDLLVKLGEADEATRERVLALLRGK